MAPDFHLSFVTDIILDSDDRWYGLVKRHLNPTNIYAQVHVF